MTDSIFCSECGAKMKSTENFCQNCGHQLGTAAKPDPEATEQPVQQDQAATPTIATPPTPEEKNKLILLMVLSIIIPIVGIVLGIIKYNKKDKKSGQHYLLCGLAGICFGLGAAHFSGFIIGAVLIASAVYTGLQSINKGEISADF